MSLTMRDTGRHIYLGYGVDKERGYVTNIRPDQHAGWIGEIEDVEGLEAYFENVLVVQKREVVTPLNFCR